MQKKILFLMLFIMTLSSCTYYAYQRLMHVKMGMTSTEVMELMDSDEFNDDDITLINGSEDIYDITNELKSQKNVKVLIAQKFAVLQTGSETPYYIFAFEDDKLIYWGLPLEFGRDDDTKLNQIGEIAGKIIYEKYLD